MAEAIKFTAEGVKSVVAAVMTGEAGEFILEPRDGSLLELAKQVADRCASICEADEVEMSDAVYAQAVADLAPDFADED
jgi:hypothetical protein